MDPFFHKALTLRAGARRLSLRTSQELFSSHAIDTGTLRLIRSLGPVLAAGGGARALDVGCGYGPLGLAVAELARQAGGRDHAVDLVDRDALAVAYSRANAEAAGLGATARAYGSLGYDDVDRGEAAGAAGFDLVVANLPGKAPEPVLHELLLGAARHLRPAGLAAVVVVNPLASVVDAALAAAADAEVVHRDAGREHTVVHYRFAGAPHPPLPEGAFDRGAYRRGAVRLRSARGTFEVATSHGLAEFDQLAFSTSLALELLDGSGGSSLAVVNPGQGHLAVATTTPETESVHLADRDLLALRTTVANLRRAGYEGTVDAMHEPAAVPPGPVDLAVVNVRAKEPAVVAAAQVAGALAGLRPGGRLVVAGATTPVLRAVGAAPRPRRELRRRGHLAVELLAQGDGAG